MDAGPDQKYLWRNCLRLLVLALGLAGGASALDPRLSLTQYIHSRWTTIEASPIPEVHILAQTADGYLWLGTSEGLFRFDGLRFVPWAAPPGQPALSMISSLTASKAGGLWIGTRTGLRRLEQGSASRSAVQGMLSSANIMITVEDGAGRLWAGGKLAGDGGLALWENGVTRIFGTREGLPSPLVSSLYEERDGALWVSTMKGSCRWVEGRCASGVPPIELAAAAVLPKGAAKIATARLRDKDGNLWVGSLVDGLYCLRNGRVEHFTSLNGLSSDSVLSVIEDREGNIWVGTTQGLDRFREPTVTRWSTSQGLAGNLITAVCASRSGDVWIASYAGLNCMRRNRLVTPNEFGRSATTVLSLLEDAGGTLWAGTLGGLLRQSGGRFIEVPADGAPFHRVFAMAQRPGGTLWLADENRGLGTVRNGRVVPEALPGIAPGKSIRQLVSDENGNLWVGYREGGVTRVADGSGKFFGPEAGLAGGAVQAIASDRLGNLWVGTADGLSRLRQGAWTTWTSRDGIPEGGVQAIVDDRCGHLWLVLRGGISAVAHEELNQSPAGKPRRLRLAVYGPNDGVRMTQSAPMFNPRIARSTDGALWIGTNDGVAGINPASIRTNRIPPPVAIEQVSVDGRPLDAVAARAGVRGRQVQFEYTALSLSLPENVRFRYKVEGFDPDWIDAQNRRQIVYANLPPGPFRFAVTACNSDGIWNTTGAGFAFRIAPYFYQTWWFAVACAGAMVAFAYSLHRLRVRRLRSRFQLVLQERSRLTRELHDTVLQGFAGVVYQLEAASRQLVTSPDSGKLRIDRALEQADQSLREAREALSCLRLSALQDKSLPEALKVAGGQILEGTGISFEINVRGKARELPYEAQATIYIIAREAMNNAMNHAQPGRVRLDLEYNSHAVRLLVQDDGKGFDLQQSGQREDHWGLAGMRERARQIGAGLQIDSAPGRGTKVELVVNGRA